MKKIKNNPLLITLLLITILTTNTTAIVSPPNTIAVTTTNTPNTITNEQLQNQITQEAIKTRAEITAYTDRKTTELIQTFRIDGQKFIDENFKVLDQRMQDLATKTVIKITIGIIILS